VVYQPAGAFARIAGDAAAHAAAVRGLVPACFPEGWVAEMAAQMAATEPSGWGRLMSWAAQLLAGGFSSPAWFSPPVQFARP
jgi:hypothetical protein